MCYSSTQWWKSQGTVPLEEHWKYQSSKDPTQAYTILQRTYRWMTYTRVIKSVVHWALQVSEECFRIAYEENEGPIPTNMKSGEADQESPCKLLCCLCMLVWSARRGEKNTHCWTRLCQRIENTPWSIWSDFVHLGSFSNLVKLADRWFSLALKGRYDVKASRSDGIWAIASPCER